MPADELSKTNCCGAATGAGTAAGTGSGSGSTVRNGTSAGIVIAGACSGSGAGRPNDCPTSLSIGRTVTLNPAGDFCTRKPKFPISFVWTNSTSELCGSAALVSDGISGKTIILIWVPSSGTFATSLEPEAETRYGFFSGSRWSSSLQVESSAWRYSLSFSIDKCGRCCRSCH